MRATNGLPMPGGISGEVQVHAHGGDGMKVGAPAMVQDSVSPIRRFCDTCDMRFTTRDAAQTTCDHCLLKAQA